MVSVSSGTASYYQSLAEASDEYEDFEAGLPSGMSLDTQNATVYAFDTLLDGAVAVVFPICGALDGSNYQLLFDPATDNVVHETSLLGVLSNTPGADATVIMVVDGTTTWNGDVDYDDVIQGLSSKLRCLNDCLAGLGIANWVLALIGVGCGIVCGGTLGTGCIVCLVAVVGILDFQAGYCVGQCRNASLPPAIGPAPQVAGGIGALMLL